MNFNPSSKKIRRVALAWAVMVLVAGIFFWRPGKPLLPAGKNVAASAPATPSNFVARAGVATNSSASVPAQYATFQKRPFAVVRQNGHYEWTAEDGRAPANIRRLAHNDAEYQRMTNENNTVFRRQLVYQQQPVSLAAQRAVHFGEPISQVTLPGLDGRELVMDVTKSEIESGGDRGTITGKLAGRSGSMVVLAFAGGREGFTVVSPQDYLYLHAEPREPGEIVVKMIDPNTYGGELKDCVVAKPASSSK